MATATSQKKTEKAASPGCCAPERRGLPSDEALASSTAALKAIAHPVRLKILHVLGAGGAPVCACDIESHFTLSQPTISHHLRLLREAGLVESDQRGSWVYYSIRRSAVAKISQSVAELLA